VYADLFNDQRYDPSVDDVMLVQGEHDSNGKGGSGKRGDNAKTWWGGNMPKVQRYDEKEGGNPVVLSIPVSERSERALRRTRKRATTKLTLFLFNSFVSLHSPPPCSIKNAPHFARRRFGTTTASSLRC
tara:strand:- start:242 stop:628 length:387 start_codon:yes stop_codon:yes gene_type:complete